MIEIDITGTRFQLSPLKPLDSLRGLALLTEKVFPVALEAAKTLGGEGRDDVFFAKLASAGASLPELYALFLERSKVFWHNGFVDLKTFEAPVFERKPTLILAWLAAALRYEYADFLAEEGRARLAETVNQFRSLMAAPGQSGG